MRKFLLVLAALLLCFVSGAQIVNHLKVDGPTFQQYAKGRMQLFNPSNLALADSLYTAGVNSNSYKLKCLGLSLEMPVRYARKTPLAVGGDGFCFAKDGAQVVALFGGEEGLGAEGGQIQPLRGQRPVLDVGFQRQRIVAAGRGAEEFGKIRLHRHLGARRQEGTFKLPVFEGQRGEIFLDFVQHGVVLLFGLRADIQRRPAPGGGYDDNTNGNFLSNRHIFVFLKTFEKTRKTARRAKPVMIQAARARGYRNLRNAANFARRARARGAPGGLVAARASGRFCHNAALSCLSFLLLLRRKAYVVQH